MLSLLFFYSKPLLKASTLDIRNQLAVDLTSSPAASSILRVSNAIRSRPRPLGLHTALLAAAVVAVHRGGTTLLQLPEHVDASACSVARVNFPSARSGPKVGNEDTSGTKKLLLSVFVRVCNFQKLRIEKMHQQFHSKNHIKDLL